MTRLALLAIVGAATSFAPVAMPAFAAGAGTTTGTTATGNGNGTGNNTGNGTATNTNTNTNTTTNAAATGTGTRNGQMACPGGQPPVRGKCPGPLTGGNNNGNGNTTGNNGRGNGTSNGQGNGNSNNDNNNGAGSHPNGNGPTGFNFSGHDRDMFHQRFRSFHFPSFAVPNFSVNVGVTVPRSYRLQPVPRDIYRDYPQFRGDLYFVLRDGSIAIVSPRSLRIIAVL
jgi:hypothetical protein